MFKKIKELIRELDSAKNTLDSYIKESKKLAKENKQLLSRIEAAEKRGGSLLLENLSEDLVKKLQELTEDNVIVFFLKDGTRMEIKKEGVSYKRDNGFVR